MLGSLAGDHELDVVPGIEDEPSGVEEDHQARCSPRAVHRSRSPELSTGRTLGRWLRRRDDPWRDDGDPVSREPRARSTSSPARSGPVATSRRHQRRLSRRPPLDGPEVGDRLDVRQLGSLRQGQGRRRPSRRERRGSGRGVPAGHRTRATGPRSPSASGCPSAGTSKARGSPARSLPLERQRTWRRQPRRSSRSSRRRRASRRRPG